MSDKTEDPTPRRLRKAREDGDSGASAFASQAVAFLVAVVVAPSAVGATAAYASRALRVAIAGTAAAASLSHHFAPAQLARPVLQLVAPILLCAAVAGGAAQLTQTGGAVAFGRLAPKLERLDPVAGLRGLFSWPRVFAVIRALTAGMVVGWLAFAGLREHWIDVARTSDRLGGVPPAVGAIAGSLAWRAALVGLALAVVDLVVMRGAWRRRLRMTKDEVKREHRDAQGDPHLKAARARAHHELLAQATLAAVRNASVVVVNPTHRAAALRYDEASGDAAPVVLLAGEGFVASAIVRAARDYEVPVVRDIPLARALSELEPGSAIPEALYEAVAVVLREALGETEAEGDGGRRRRR